MPSTGTSPRSSTISRAQRPDLAASFEAGLAVHKGVLRVGHVDRSLKNASVLPRLERTLSHVQLWGEIGPGYFERGEKDGEPYRRSRCWRWSSEIQFHEGKTSPGARLP